MFKNILLVLIAIFSIIYIFEIGIASSPFIILFKLIPMILIIILAITTKPVHQKSYFLLIVVGLIFCAIGDYTLQWFIVGLSFFLIGHLFYISAFITAKKQRSPKIVLIILLIFGIIVASIIVGGLINDGEMILAGAVLLYISIILTMGWTAWGTNNLYAILGSCLFILSDTVLAINKFTMDVPFSGQIIMITYYGAQLLFALSISKYSVFRNKVIQ